MKEIKFRAWDKVREKMVAPKDVFLLPKREGHAQAMSGDGKNYELMQFTGLKDKSGKEIYEGDILKSQKNGYVWEVVYREPSFRFKRSGTVAFAPAPTVYSKAEIIGNIYENPELLESGQRDTL